MTESGHGLGVKSVGVDAEREAAGLTSSLARTSGGRWQALALSVAQWPTATRIVLLALLPLLALGTAGGLWLRGQMQQALWGSFDQVLQDKAQRVAARLQLGPRMDWQEAPGSADEFSTIYSGWYWSAALNGQVLRSRSLWDMDSLPLQASPVSAAVPLYMARGPLQEPLMARTVDLSVGQPAQAVRLTVYGPASATWASLQRIDHTLMLAGVMLVLLAVALCWLQVRVGLAPLRRLESLLSTVRQPHGAGQEGKWVDVQAMLQAPTGRDLQPLQAELASLWEHNTRVVTRARAHAADLNHALKKPLALLSAQASTQAAVPAADVQRQVQAMAHVIDRYQARTFSDALHIHAAAHPAAAAQPVDVAQCAAEVVRMMERLHAAQSLTWELQVPPGAAPLWRGERTDLEEVLGNVLDNAGKWAASTVHLRLDVEEGSGTQSVQVVLCIEDDGPGMAPSQLQAAGQRGLRFDDAVQGSGLGLHIATQIVQAYGGVLALGKSAALKGLAVRVTLPVAHLAQPIHKAG